MAQYQLTATGVLRVSDRANIPSDPRNADWREYLDWKAKGGVPDAAGPTGPTGTTFAPEQLIRALKTATTAKSNAFLRSLSDVDRADFLRNGAREDDARLTAALTAASITAAQFKTAALS